MLHPGWHFLWYLQRILERQDKIIFEIALGLNPSNNQWLEKQENDLTEIRTISRAGASTLQFKMPSYSFERASNLEKIRKGTSTKNLVLLIISLNPDYCFTMFLRKLQWQTPACCFILPTLISLCPWISLQSSRKIRLKFWWTSAVVPAKHDQTGVISESLCSRQKNTFSQNSSC